MAHLPQLDVNDAARRSLARRKLELRHLARLSRFAPQRRARRAGSRPPRVAPAAHRACVCPGDDRLGFLPRADARAEHAHCPPDVHAPTRSRPLAPLAILVRRDPSGTRDRGGTLRLVRAAGLRAGLGMVCGGGCVAVLSGNTRRTWRGDPVCVFPGLTRLRLRPTSVFRCFPSVYVWLKLCGGETLGRFLPRTPFSNRTEESSAPPAGS